MRLVLSVNFGMSGVERWRSKDYGMFQSQNSVTKLYFVNLPGPSLPAFWNSPVVGGNVMVVALWNYFIGRETDLTLVILAMGYRGLELFI